MDISFEVKGVKEFMGALSSAPAVLDAANLEAMNQSVFLVEAEAKANEAPHTKTGRLFSSIHGEVKTAPLEGRVGTSVEYGPYLEFGTAPHEIAPVAKLALFWPGALHPVSLVHHPGQRADPFMKPALDDSKDSIQDFFSQAAKKLTEHLAGR